MFSKAITLKAIQQVDNHHFQIEWSDETLRKYKLTDLQVECSCAACQQTPPEQRPVDPNVRAERIVGVGRYALRIVFTSGCSNGIFAFDRLYELGKA
jgi:DUF971 family protein